MPHIVLLPLDDRPPNLRYPTSLAQSLGFQINIPPRPLLGNFLTAGEPEALADWLLEAGEGADCAVISLEMLAYGGLVASRTAAVELKKVLLRLETINELHSRYPHLRIFLASMIMRSSITVSSDATRKYWELVNQFSVLADREGMDAPETQKVKAEIPEVVLAEYLKARARNHAVNQSALEFIRTGNAEFLVFSQEDAAAFGFHKREQKQLQEQLSKLRLGDRVMLTTGGDEIMTDLVGRAADTDRKFEIIYSDPEGSQTVPLYEDKEIGRTVLEHIGLVGGKIGKGDIALFVNGSGSGDLFGISRTSRVSSGERISRVSSGSREFVKKINEAIKERKKVALADITYANGADPEFMEVLLGEVDIKKLASFAAWNTAANSIGTALADALSPDPKALLYHFLDDYIYQSLVRPELKKTVQKAGVSPYNLGEGREKTERAMQEMMLAKAGDFVRQYFPFFKIDKGKFTFPWPRIFEVEINL